MSMTNVNPELDILRRDERRIRLPESLVDLLVTFIFAVLRLDACVCEEDELQRSIEQEILQDTTHYFVLVRTLLRVILLLMPPSSSLL
jgi:hypothetical protein